MAFCIGLAGSGVPLCQKIRRWRYPSAPFSRRIWFPIYLAGTKGIRFDEIGGLGFRQGIPKQAEQLPAGFGRFAFRRFLAGVADQLPQLLRITARVIIEP